MISNMFNLKNVCVLAYCHSHLIEAEAKLKSNDYITVITDDIKREKVRNLGLKIIKYCEDNNYTKEFLEYQLISKLVPMAQRYFGNAISVYSAEIKENHVPLLFAIMLFKRLSIDGKITGLMEEIKECILIFQECDLLEKVEIESKLTKGKINIKHVELIRYGKVVDDIFIKMNSKQKRKK